MTIEFSNWWFNNKSMNKAEKIYGKRASAICERVDPNIEVINLYTDVLEKLAFKYSMHLL